MEYRFGEKTLIALIVMLSIFGPISTDMFLPALGDMCDYFHCDEPTLNSSLYVFMFSMAVSILILGTLSDKYGRRLVLSISMCIYIAMNIVCCITDSIAVFIAARAVEAIGGGGALAISMALEKDFFEGEKLQKVIAITVALGIIGPVVSPVLGNGLILLANWQATFWAPAIIAAICLVLALALPKEIPIERYGGSVIGSVTHLGRFLRHRGFTIFMMMVSVFAAAQLAYVAVSSYIYEDTFGMDGTQYSLTMAVALIIALVLATAITHLQGRIGTKGVLLFIPVFGLITGVVLLLFGSTHWWMFTLGMIPVLTVTIMGRTVGFGILLNEFDEDNGAVSSLINFVNFMFCCVGMVLATAPFWADYISGIGWISIGCFAVFVLLAALFKVGKCSLKEL